MPRAGSNDEIDRQEWLRRVPGARALSWYRETGVARPSSEILRSGHARRFLVLASPFGYLEALGITPSGIALRVAKRVVFARSCQRQIVRMNRNPTVTDKAVRMFRRTEMSLNECGSGEIYCS